MPGLVGTIQRSPHQDLQSLFTHLVAPMARGSRLRSEHRVDASGVWAIGRVHLGVLQPSPQLDDRSSSLQVVFHGDLHNEDELRAALPAGALPQSATGIAPLVGAWYRREGPSIARRLTGAFCAAIVDADARRVVIINDLLGSYPLYWFAGPSGLTFASELKAVLREPTASRTVDPRAVADYLQFGFVFGDRTLANGVRLLPSASTLEYDWTTGSCEVKRYRRVADLFQPNPEPDDRRLDRLEATFQDAVVRAQQGAHAFGLSLSGGLDTRAILSAVSSATGPIATYTLGVKGCADEVIADQLAAVTGTKHRFFELDSRYLSEFLLNVTRMVSLTDGMYLSHGLTEMLALQFLSDSDFTVLLRGHCGELAKATLAWPLHTDVTVQAMRDTQELIPYLLQRIDYVGHGIDGLFTGDWSQAMKGGPAQSLAESLAGVSLSPSDACAYLYLDEQHRRFTVASLEIFRNILDVRLPFADEAFLTDLLSSPLSLRSDTRIHRRLIAPRLLRVRNSNTGAPANAGPLVEAVLDKFNTLFKRLNVYGYRHYHDFDAWMKQQLLTSVETVLLDPGTLRRRMLHEPTLRRLIETTRAGTADHGYLFQVLLILELWQRENVH